MAKALINRVFYIMLLIGFGEMTASAQEAYSPLTLSEVLAKAEEQSLMSLRARNRFLAGHWQYQAYRASLLPRIDWDITPVDYNRAFDQQFDINNRTFVYVETQVLSNSSSLGISQNVAATGGTVSLSTSLSHLEDIEQAEFSAFNASPVQLVYQQPIWGFNRFKWEKKIRPLAYDLAQKEYLETVGQVRIRATGYYFDLLLANKRLEIAKENVAIADTLYRLGQKRFQIAAIDREELLNLQLNQFTAETELGNALKEVQKANFNLNTLLGMAEDLRISEEVPLPNFVADVSLDEALERAERHSPAYLGLRLGVLEAERTLEEAERETRAQANLFASFGLNNSAGSLSETYNDFSNRQRVQAGIRIPLVDWGQGKGLRLFAEKEKELAEIEARQGLQEFEQQLAVTVIDYNQQQRLVENAQKAAEIAEEVYLLTTAKFIQGNSTVLELNNAANARQTRREAYINALSELWLLHFRLQQFTLYDFEKRSPLSKDFEELLE